MNQKQAVLAILAAILLGLANFIPLRQSLLDDAKPMSLWLGPSIVLRQKKVDTDCAYMGMSAYYAYRGWPAKTVGGEDRCSGVVSLYPVGILFNSIVVVGLGVILYVIIRRKA